MSSSDLETKYNLDRLDKGWFYCYKILVYIYFGFTTLDTPYNFGLAIYALFDLERDSRTHFASGTCNLYLMWLLYCQLAAIKYRDFTDAREAMNGFIYFIFIKTAIFLIAFFLLYKYLDVTSAILLGAPLIVFICIFFGSIQVYLLLKKNESSEYQNVDPEIP